jgi:hypothetical protein
MGVSPDISVEGPRAKLALNLHCRFDDSSGSRGSLCCKKERQYEKIEEKHL